MKALKVILTMGFAVLEILFFINYYNVFYRIGEVNIAILLAGWLAQISLFVGADYKATESNMFENARLAILMKFEKKPNYLGNFIIAIGFISGESFLVSSVFLRDYKAAFFISSILMLVTMITSVVTLWKECC